MRDDGSDGGGGAGTLPAMTKEAAMPATSKTERALRQQIHRALAESRRILRSYPQVTPGSEDAISEAQSSFQLLAQCLAEAAASNRLLRELDHLSMEGQRAVGAVDVALLVLGDAVLATLAAELDFARSAA